MANLLTCSAAGRWRIVSLLMALLLCAATFSAQAQDDLYFNPKKQREIDRQNAKIRAYHDSIRAAQRAIEAAEEEDYVEKWGNLDSVDERGYRGIYDLSRADSDERYEEEPERESYADRLRYDDPTYVVYARDPFLYDPYYSWGWNGYYSYPYHGWGLTYSSGWGWSVGWSYPYYGWGYPHYAWSYPYYGGGWGYHHHHSYPSYAYNHRRQGRHSGSIAGTNSGTGYTNSRSSGNYSQRRLNMPSSGSVSSSSQGSSVTRSRAYNSFGSSNGVTGSGRSRSSSSSYSTQPSSSSRSSSYNSNSSYSSGSSRSSYTPSRSSGSSYSAPSRSSGGGGGGGGYTSSGRSRR